MHTVTHYYSHRRSSDVNCDKLFSAGTSAFTPFTPMSFPGIMVTSTQNNNRHTTHQHQTTNNYKTKTSHTYAHSQSMHTFTLLLTAKVQRRQVGQTLQCRYQRLHTLYTDFVPWYHGDINTKQPHNTHQHQTTKNYKTTNVTHIHSLTIHTHIHITTHRKDSATSSGTNSSVPVPAPSHPLHLSLIHI